MEKKELVIDKENEKNNNYDVINYDEIEIDEHSTIDFYYSLKEVFLGVIPVSLSSISIILLETVNILFIRNLPNSTDILNAFGLGIFLVNTLGVSPNKGFTEAISTLCSQANGGRKYRLLGIYVSICRIIQALYILILYTPIAVYSYEIFNLFISNEKLCYQASQFSNYMIPSVFLNSQTQLMNRYLQSMKNFNPELYISLFALVIHVFFSWFYTSYLNLELLGSALSLTTTQLIQCIILIIYIKFIFLKNEDEKINHKDENHTDSKSIEMVESHSQDKDSIIKLDCGKEVGHGTEKGNSNDLIIYNQENEKESVFNSFIFYSEKVFTEPKYFFSFMVICIPSFFLCILLSIAFESIVIISSLLGENEFAASICMFNINMVVYMISSGFSHSTCSFVGNSIGKYQLKVTKTYVKASAILSCFFGVALTIILFIFESV